MEPTTELGKLRDGADFTWGQIRKWHDVGPYVIAEFHPLLYIDGHSSGRRINAKDIEYHVWIDGKDSCRGYHSLDAALAGAIAYRVDGINSRAGEYFVRMLAEGKHAR